jgi:hypothetical protein
LIISNLKESIPEDTNFQFMIASLGVRKSRQRNPSRSAEKSTTQIYFHETLWRRIQLHLRFPNELEIAKHIQTELAING